MVTICQVKTIRYIPGGRFAAYVVRNEKFIIRGEKNFQKSSQSTDTTVVFVSEV